MYRDSGEVAYAVRPAGGRAAVELRIQQQMDAEDLCAIFDDAWLGSRVWEATTTFCDRLCGDPPLVPALAGSAVLELGAGTGIGGLVAAALGAADVVTTDMESPQGTLNLIRHNIELNSEAIAAAQPAAAAIPRLRAAALDWTAAPSAAWRAEFEPAAGFNTILAAECIYTGIESGEAAAGGEREVWRALAETICALARPHTAVFVCSKERGMQLHDSSNDDEEVGECSRSEPAAEGGGDEGAEGAEGARSGSLVVDFTQHMERECDFAVEVLSRPPEGEQRLGGLWLLRMQRRASDQEEPELEPEI
eukprot:COSAG04_NODE_5143_length_1721_cov_71.471023_2_plen_307_part_00